MLSQGKKDVVNRYIPVHIVSTLWGSYIELLQCMVDGYNNYTVLDDIELCTLGMCVTYNVHSYRSVT